MKVHLRQRKQTKSGKISLYLEIYKGTITKPDGKIQNQRDYEYLNLYLIDKPKNPIDKQHNKDTLQLAESIKAKRQIDIKNGIYGFNSKFNENVNFIEFFKKIMEKRKNSLGNYGNWSSTLKHLINYAGHTISFKQIDTAFCEGFKEYLTKKAVKKSGSKLSSSASSSYFNKFRSSLKEAVKQKIILSNPAMEVPMIRVIENKRNFLTFEELNQIAKTECRYDVLKRAFIFSCLTGLRWSDINKLKWSEIQNNNGEFKIVFHQKKTKGLQYLDISKQAAKCLGKTGSNNERVFTGLTYSSYMNVELSKWMLKAGITKDITFHCARHTFAVIQLTYGTDIYTLQKLLGHTDLKTTEIYANIIDEKKKEAVNRIPDISIDLDIDNKNELSDKEKLLKFMNSSK